MHSILCSQQSLNLSDLISIGSTIVLVLAAISVPYIVVRVNRRFNRPKLQVHFISKQPACHKTRWNRGPEILRPVYYFRFVVENKGKSTCRNVENAIENIWIYDSSNKPVKLEDFTPINLKWSINWEKQLQDLNPGRRIFCNIGYIPKMEFQESSQQKEVDPLIYPKEHTSNDLCLVINFTTRLLAQLNCLPPGSYILQINTYSENHTTLTNYIKIDWSGEWKDDEDLMFQELVISTTSKPT